MVVRLAATAFDPWQEIVDRQAARPDLAGGYGATAVFVGSLRDFNQGHAVSAMTLEHYPSMTLNYLEKVEQEARGRWPLLDSLVVHRHGPLTPNDPIVLVAVWAAHRDDAFSACRYIIDELKTRAPFWKREQTPDGSRWVEKQ